MINRLALRNLAHKPWRTALLLGGYGLGVGVMIVLLSIGEALLTQARDERLVGGGQITVLPEGLDVEVMKTGGIGGLYFSIDRARFIYRQFLAAPRLAPAVSAVAPQIDGKLVYLRAGGREYAVRASGEIPSRNAAVGAAASLAGGRWSDDAGDRRWIEPTPRELYSEIDHFHRPPAGLQRPESWGEWHYFNVLSDDGRSWAFISYIVAGDIRGGRWGGQLAITLRDQGGRTRRFAAAVADSGVRFSTTSPDLRMGGATVTLLDDGRYALRGQAREEGGAEVVTLDLVVTPAPRAYFPGATLAECAPAGPSARADSSCDFVSGYAVAALRGEASGSVCVAGRCRRFDGAQAYHDHNWGVWRGVVWDWGAARAGSYTLLYGQVRQPDSSAGSAPLFFYLVDSLGFRALFRPQRIRYTGARTILVDGAPVRVPSGAVLEDVRGGDTLRVELTIEDAVGTDTRRPLVERGDLSAARELATPYFIQMKGTARLSGRVGGHPLSGTGRGFFETYRGRE